MPEHGRPDLGPAPGFRGQSEAEASTSPLASTDQRTSRGALTRERILVEASRLFAVRGYFGTSTRDIADAVGLKQPSLFFHFATKQAIAEELLSYSLVKPTAVARDLLRGEELASVRLYRYIWFDTQHLLQSPYDLTGVHGDDLMNATEFVVWKKKAQKLRRDIQNMLKQGQDDGSMRSVDVVLTQELISGMNLNTIRMAHSERRKRTSHVPQFVADFTLRALLVDVDTLRVCRETAVDGLTSLGTFRSVQDVPIRRRHGSATT